LQYCEQKFINMLVVLQQAVDAQENFVGGGRWDNAATVTSIVIAISAL
jgi:hypothetical protein